MKYAPKKSTFLTRIPILPPKETRSVRVLSFLGKPFRDCPHVNEDSPRAFRLNKKMDEERRESDVRLRHIEERQAKQDAAIHEIAASVSEGFRKIHEEFSELAIDLNNKVSIASKRETNWGWFIGAVSLCLTLGYASLAPIESRLDRYYTETVRIQELLDEHNIQVAATNATQSQAIKDAKEYVALISENLALKSQKGDSVLAERVEMADMVAKKARDLLLETQQEMFTTKDAEQLKQQIQREIDDLKQ